MADRPTKPVTPAPSRDRAPKTRIIGRGAAPFEDVYHWVLTLSWPRFFALCAASFLAVNFVFAVLYTVRPDDIANARTLEDHFYFSVQTMGTIGYGGMYPTTRIGHVLVTVEALLGIFYIALITGLTFARFARPTSRVLFSEKAVIAPRNGVPHLMFRLANLRHNNVTEAQLRVLVLQMETSTEGVTMRMPVELELVRDRTALFIMTWTAMHPITPTSPFYGEDAFAKLRERRAEVFLSLTGTDETLASSVHARYYYGLDDIVPNATFADVLTILPDGTRQIDYARFHDTVALTPAANTASTSRSTNTSSAA